ncbi:MAG: cytochrome b/b6, partial [Hyphomonadaceae bacterium]|nr:cytochrome b/b6 [Hyphomonadaceae bacterium]
LPFVIAGVVVLHIWALHVPGNNNPTGVSVKDVKKDTLPFHPYYTVKDGFAIILFLIMFALFVFYFPNALGHADNSIEANPLQTPAHIVPEWYLLPFYAILRAVNFNVGPIDAKVLGVFAMFGSILILFVLPWLDTSKVRSMRYRPVARSLFVVFVFASIGLGFCGANDPDKFVFNYGPDKVALVYTDTNGQPVREVSNDYAALKAKQVALPPTAGAAIEVHSEGFKWLWLSQILGAYYFMYFLVLLPLLGVIEKPKPRPASIADSVRKKHGSAPAAAVAAE